MPAADRSLEHIISAERIAGVDLKAIKMFGVDIASALQYLHDNRKGQGLVHGDFKPRNIVRIHGDWKLIDFDASVQVAITYCTNHQHIKPRLSKAVMGPSFINTRNSGWRATRGQEAQQRLHSA
jgi:serine/threonine protein kinase